MMKVLFAIPPQILRSPGNEVDVKPSISIPLGPLYMIAYLRSRRWQGETYVYDARLSAGKQEQRSGGTWTFFGDSWGTVERTIAAYSPDVVAISSLFSVQIEAALDLARRSKKVCPGAVTVLGGSHASSFPQQMIEEPNIDYVVVGEGEERLHILLEALKTGETVASQGILGKPQDAVHLRKNKRAPVTFIKDVDSLPLPAYEMVDVDRYFYLQAHGYAPRVREYGKRAATILTSRGCPHQCIFCSVQTTVGYKFRPHSPEYVATHIEHLRANYKIDYIHFEDDNFTHDIERYEKILDVLLDQHPIIHWDTPNGVRADSWTKERISRTKASGAQYLCIGIESSVQRVIDDVIKKNLDLSKVEPVMQACHEVGLPLSAFYVLGLPGETAAEVKANVDYAIDKYERYGVYPTFSIANPLPGTELYDIVEENGLLHGISADDPRKSNNPIIKTDEFDPDYIQSMYDMANRKKMLVTVKEMLSNPRSLVKYVEMSMKNPWFFKTIVRSMSRSLLRGLGPVS